MELDGDARELLAQVPDDGSGVGNQTLMRLLGWGQRRYEVARDLLVQRELLVKGPGYGGSVRRGSAEYEDQKVLAVLHGLGGSAGNLGLMRELGWTEAKYYRVRDRLLDRGELVRGPGRGGSVRLVEEGEEEAPTEQAEVQAAILVRESELYEPIARVLRRSFAQDKNFKWHHVEITARQGRRATGGRWTRPDITMVSLTRFRYVPGLHLEVFTFEVKTRDAVDVTAVYESLAHTRFGTRAYVVFPFPEDPEGADRELLDAVVAEAERHGVGVFTMTDPGDYQTWDELVAPVRTDADPEATNEFIATQLSPDAQAELQDQLR
jgi:hypothetical protein